MELPLTETDKTAGRTGLGGKSGTEFWTHLSLRCLLDNPSNRQLGI